MKLLLKNIKTYWLTCDKAKNRWPSMELMLNTLGINGEKINGEITSPYTIGIAKNHRDALIKSGDSIVHILEDDATLTNSPLEFLEAPDDCDAIYLGTSLFGRIRKGTVYSAVISEKYNDQLLRIYNMLSLHSVIYTTKKYKDKVIEIIDKFIQNPIGGMDDPIADIMYKYKVYCLQSPMFYQNDGHSEVATLGKISPIFL